VHHPYDLSLILWSNGAPEHAGTDKQPAVTPNDEPSQGYQDSWVHSACADDAVVPASGHTLKPAGTSCLYHARYASCAAHITLQAAERRLTERCLAGSPSGEHDLTRFTDDPLAVGSHSLPQCGQTALHGGFVLQPDIASSFLIASPRACDSLNLALKRQRIAGNTLTF
jgi:hypothetical protein